MKVLYFIVPLLLSAVLIQPVKLLAFKFRLYAKENNRTVHHGNIPRIGGVAIFLAFMIASFFFMKDNDTFKSIILGGIIIFVGGLIDDIVDLPAKVKLLFQFAGATALIFLGHVYLTAINLPFGIILRFDILGYVVTYFWVIGITNAINLIDGLDGLAGGFSIIVLVTIAILSTVLNGPNEYVICIVLAGAVMGFLYYNFHPASIFMGDCGSQFLGYMISAISLYGFKSTTFITLAIPIILLFVPILDTLVAIVRRKLAGQKFSTPDKSHFHHKLMNSMKLGQTGAVLVVYVITTLFGFTAYLVVVYAPVGYAMLVFLIFIFELFIEYSGMISKNYRPILNMVDRLVKPGEPTEDNDSPE